MTFQQKTSGFWIRPVWLLIGPDRRRGQRPLRRRPEGRGAPRDAVRGRASPLKVSEHAET